MSTAHEALLFDRLQQWKARAITAEAEIRSLRKQMEQAELDFVDLKAWAKDIAASAEAENAKLRAKLEWYATQFCEGIGECVGDFCGKLTADECAGCPARAARETDNG